MTRLAIHRRRARASCVVCSTHIGDILILTISLENPTLGMARIVARS
jgi:hypothetical protein